MKNSEDIVNKINDALPFNKETIRAVINKTFAEVKERISKGDKVMLRGFAKFVSSSDKKTKTYNIETIKQLKTKNK
tara:strand:+ start:646 stop:873 length:228 start_codon:yes stop_codon:yes gene_type:complete